MNAIRPGREIEALEKTFGAGKLLDSLPIGVCCCGCDGRIRQMNRRARELWGRSPETDERFDGAYGLFLPDGTPVAREDAPMAQVLRTARPVRNRPFNIERPDGRRIKIVADVEPLFDEDGALVGAVNCFREADEAAAAGDNTQLSSDVDDSFENGAVALHIVDRNGIILRANRAELDLLGYEEAEYVGHHISEFHADKAALEHILGQLARGQKIDQHPARLIAKDGSIRHVLVTSNACFRDGAFVRTRCFTIDVTASRHAEEQAQERERRLQEVLLEVPVAVYMTDADGVLTFCNRAAIEMAGREPRIGHDKWCVFGRLFSIEGAPLPLEQSTAATALREKRFVDSVEFIGERPDGSRVRAIAYPMPLFKENGRLVGLVNMMVDISERHRAEVESAYLAAIVSSSSDAIVSKTLDGIIQSWNAGATRIFGYLPEEIIGQPVTTIIPPELQDQEEEILSRLRRGERINHFETERLTKDGRRIDISLTISPIHDRSGRIIGASKIARDITDRKRAERLQRLLISELNHRVKNTLATVQSIANQTVRYARNPQEAAASFSGRIQALAHTHDLLTRNSWQGADVLRLARDQLLFDGAEDSRISFSGPALTLDPHPTLHLALILHELGTNARKYGSLSVPEGRLDVNWTLRSGNEGSRLLLSWRESGGPPVKAPTQRGFGTTLIKRSLASHGGEVSIDYRAEGLVCHIMLPVPERTHSDESGFANAIPVTTSRPAAERASSESAGLRGLRVLVVEDEALIAMDIVATLTEAGCKVVGPAATVETAEKLIATEEIDAALLDANLDGRSVETIAVKLTRNRIPFAFLTGYEREALPEAFREAPLISKPFTRSAAIDMLSLLTASDSTVVRMPSRGG